MSTGPGRAVFAAILVASACSAPTPAPTSDIPQRGGRIVHAIGGEVLTLQPVLTTDPTAFLAIGLVYAPIVQLDPKTGAVAPNLARWTASADGLTYTWQIEERAVWSDGRPVVAVDWLTGLKALAVSKGSPRKGSVNGIVGFAEYAGGTASEIAGVRLDPQDPKRWTVRFRQVFCPAVTSASGFALPSHVFGKYVDGSSTVPFDAAPENLSPPVASGPFTFKERRVDQLVLARNDRYWKGAPYVDEYVLRGTARGSPVHAYLRAGEANLGQVGAVDADELAKQPQLAVHSFPALAYQYIGWDRNSSTAPFLRDRAVRQALSYGIDVELIIAKLVFGRATRVLAHHPPTSWASPNAGLELYRYDPARAEALLRQAGYARGADGIYAKDGQRIRFTLSTASGPALENVALTVAEQYGRIGVQVTVTSEALASLYDPLISGTSKAEAWLLVWFLPAGDPDPVNFWGADAIPDPARKRIGFNVTGFTTPEFQRAIDEARGPSNGDCSQPARKRHYDTFNRILNEEQPYTFLYSVDTNMVADRSLRGFDPGPFTQHWNVERWWLAR